MPKRANLRELAIELDLDLDEALVRVWDAGVDEVNDADQALPPEVVARARRALGLASPRQMQQISHWESVWGVDRTAVLARLKDEYGLQISPNARVLPKGALRRLRREPQPTPTTAPVVPQQRKAPDLEKLVWRPPGRRRDSFGLEVTEICQIHEALVREFEASGDPIEPSGVRDENLLHSATSRPETSLGDQRKYDTVEAYTAALVHSLVHNHPFFNGNKRTALVSMLVLLDRNGILLTCTQDELFRHVLRVAQHGLVPINASERADREVIEIARWICNNSRQIQHGERNIKWREFRRVLTKLGCEVGTPMPGNKIRLEREIQTKTRLGFKKRERLRITVGYRNDGTDVGPRQLVHIRRELRLAEADGYDAEHFYGSDSREPDSFINEYRTLLRRLARL